MGGKKAGPFEFDPLDAFASVVTGDIFKSVFDSSDDDSPNEVVNGTEGTAVDSGNESVKPVKRSNPFKPAKPTEKGKGKTAPAKGQQREHSAESDESDETDESDDSASE